METYILVSFILTIIDFILSGIVMMASKYPRTQEYSLGFDTFKIIYLIPFMLWAGYLL